MPTEALFFCGFLVAGLLAFVVYGVMNEVKFQRARRLALAEGEDVIAWIVQAPPFLYEPDSIKAWPAQVLISFRGPGKATPDQLSNTAAKAGQLTRRGANSLAETEVMALVRDLSVRLESRYRLPSEFTGGLQVWLC